MNIKVASYTSKANSRKKRIAATVRYNPSSNQVHRLDNCCQVYASSFSFFLFGSKEGER